MPAGESETDHGTTIRLCLPVLQADTDLGFEQLVDAKAPAQIMTHKEATVLVVEDEEPMARLLKNHLQLEGYHVLAAMDGSEAIELYNRHGREIDLVLMDLGLPKVTGSEVIRKLKMQNPAVKIIVTTGYLEPQLKSELFAAEVKECIYKPYSVEEILTRLQSELECS